MKTLETQRVILRQWQLSDGSDLYEYSKSPDVGPNLDGLPTSRKKNLKYWGLGIMPEVVNYLID